MPDFVNTVDTLGDDVALAKVVGRTIEEFKDNVITQLRNSAFRGCTNLHTVDLPNVIHVDSYAFAECTSLVNVSLDSAADILSSAFKQCSAIENIHLPACSRVNSYTFERCGAKRVSMPACLRLNDTAFTQCTNLARCDLPAVTYITYYAFEYCSSLVELYLPALDFVDRRAFRSCTKLCALTIPRTDKTATLGYPTFNDPSLCFNTGYIYVPGSLLDTYKADTNWSNFADRFKAMEGYAALNKWDSDYTDAGYTVVYPKTVFTTTEAGTCSLGASITFETGKTYKVLYDHNEYDIVASDQGLVHTAEDGSEFTIQQPADSANNAVQTRAELFSSVIGIYAM